MRVHGETLVDSFNHLEYSNLQAATSDGADGAFWCHQCRHENHIVQCRGKNPLQTLRCGNCEHVFCEACTSTKILKLVDHEPNSLMHVAPVPHSEVPYGSICLNCGTTHRAHGVLRILHPSTSTKVKFRTHCQCGNTGSDAGRWLLFKIGSNRDWLLKPNACYARAIEKRAERAAVIARGPGAERPTVPQRMQTEPVLISRVDVRRPALRPTLTELPKTGQLHRSNAVRYG